jgi:hypothetical protein
MSCFGSDEDRIRAGVDKPPVYSGPFDPENRRADQSLEHVRRNLGFGLAVERRPNMSRCMRCIYPLVPVRPLRHADAPTAALLTGLGTLGLAAYRSPRENQSKRWHTTTSDD